MKRSQCWSSPLFIAFCCGCLPLLVFFKALLAAILPLVVVPPVFLLIALCRSPLVFFHSYRAALTTPRLGVEFKVALVPVLIVPIVVMPFALLLLTPFYVLGMVGVEMVSAATDERCNLWIGGFQESYAHMWRHTQDLWHVLSDEVKRKADHVRRPPGAYNRYRMGVWWLPVALVAAALGSLLIGLVALINYVLKIVPLTLLVLYRWAAFYFCDFDCLRAMLFLFWITSELLLIPLVPIAGLVCVVGAFCYGLAAFAAPFRYEFKGTLWWIGRGMAGVENLVNGTMFDSLADCGCCYEVPEPNMARLRRREYRVRVDPAAAVVPADAAAAAAVASDSSSYPDV